MTKLQAVYVNLHKVHSYIKNDLIKVLKNDRNFSSDNFQQIFNNIKNVADKFCVDINIEELIIKLIELIIVKVLHLTTTEYLYIYSILRPNNKFIRSTFQ